MVSILPVVVALAQVVAVTQVPEPVPIVAAEVVRVSDRKADELYSSALAWIGDTFRSARAVIELQDRPGGRIIAKCTTDEYFGRVLLSTMSLGRLAYTVTIEVKDGRYRYVIGPFENIRKPVNMIEGGLLGPGYGILMEVIPLKYDRAPDRKRVQTLTEGARTTIAEVAKSLTERMTKPPDTW